MTSARHIRHVTVVGLGLTAWAILHHVAPQYEYWAGLTVSLYWAWEPDYGQEAVRRFAARCGIASRAMGVRFSPLAAFRRRHGG